MLLVIKDNLYLQTIPNTIITKLFRLQGLYSQNDGSILYCLRTYVTRFYLFVDASYRCPYDSADGK